MAKRGAMYDTEASPQNMLQIWTRLHTLDQQLTAAVGVSTSQQALIDSLTSQLTTAQQQLQQALIAAGKPTSANPNVPPGGGDDGGGADGAKHANYANLVQQAKDDLITEGVDLSGACGGFAIVRRAVQYIVASDPAAGLFHKSSGTGCSASGDFYSADRIIFNDGWLYDVLFDADNSSPVGAGKNPQWGFDGVADPADWRPSF